MKIDSIRWRLVLSYVLLTVLTVTLVGVLALTLLGEYVSAQTEAQMTANARSVAVQAGPLMEPSLRQDELRRLAQSISFLGRVRVQILDARSNLLVDSGMPGNSTSVVWLQPDASQNDRPVFLIPVFSALRPDVLQEKWMLDNIGQRPSMLVRIDEGAWGNEIIFERLVEGQPVDPSSPTLAWPGEPEKRIQLEQDTATAVRLPIGSPDNPLGYVQLESPRQTGVEILTAMRRALLLAGLSAGLVAFMAGLLVSRSLTAPIQALAESATRMSSGDLAARAPVRGADEIAQLARQFNTMAERLQASFAALSAERDALRRFIADASHELRTPITALKSFIELLQGPAAGDPAAREEFLSESQAQVQRMDWITSNLLDLSRLDAGLVTLNRENYDLADLLQSAAAPFLPRAQEQDIRLEVHPPGVPIQVNCDRARMEIVLGNLLDNAFKFTSRGGWIELRGEVQEGRVLILVRDGGSGIAPDDLPHIFERFYRGQTTRHGSGLGLSIVCSIVQAHGWEITVQSEVGQGSTFTIQIPPPVSNKP